MFQRRYRGVKLQPDASSESGFLAPEFDRISRVWKIKLRQAQRRARVRRDVAVSRASNLSFKRGNAARPLRWYLLLDIIALAAAFAAAWGLASFVNDMVYARPLYKIETNDGLWRSVQYCVISCGVLLHLAYRGHYRMRMPFWQEARSILITLGLAMTVDGFLQFANKQDFSRMSLMLSWLFTAGLMIGAHRQFRLFMQRRGQWQMRTLVIGEGSAAEDALEALKSEPSLGFAVAAQISDLPRIFEEAGGSWQNICARFGVDYVLIALDGVELAEAEMPIAQLIREDVPFSVAPPIRHMPVFGMVPQYFFNHDVMLLTHDRGLEQFLPRIIKRGFDMVAAGTALLLLSPVMLVVSLLVKSDGGPVFFGHKRIGCNGQVFYCLKFRTMVTNGDQILERYLRENPEAMKQWQEERKLRNDPRITLFGNFLRRSSLDELPQLINVLRGHMSLVGPRPIVMAETHKYDEDIAYYYRVRPGITGLWQVSGRNDVSYAKRVHMDIWYVRNWSLWHDITIICKTFPVLLMRAGAY